MAGLRDIGPLKIKLDVGGTTLELAGLSVADVFELSERFASFRVLIETGASSLGERLRDTPGLIRELPNAVWAALAIATGERGIAEAEAAAAALPLSVQLQMLEALMRATFREGIGPFVSTIDQLTSGVTRTAPADQTQTTAAPKKASAKSSPKRSAGAFVVDLPPEKLGRIRLASSQRI